MEWLAENWIVVLMTWAVGGFTLALLFGKAATLGKTKADQDAEDEAQMEYLDNYINKQTAEHLRDVNDPWDRSK